MSLESCMILLDNSQFMRNGDYIPSRLEAQHDAANLLVTHKTQSNAESTVGVICMSGGVFGSGSSGSGNSVELLVSPTDDLGKVLGALNGIPIRGSLENPNGGVDILASVQVASLALKHRRNKNGQQRIVIFVGSPLKSLEQRALVKAGKNLKKNNVAIDIVALGELEENEPKLKCLVDAANGTSGASGGEGSSHLVTVPAGVLPSEVIIGSPIVGGGAGASAVGNVGAFGADAGADGATETGGADTFAEFGGVDPNMDPELAMALRVSMEEERARQERLAQEQQPETESSNANAASSTTAEESKDSATASNKDSKDGEDAKMEDVGMPTISDKDMGDEDALLQQALAMSMAETNDVDIAESDLKPAAVTSTAATQDEDPMEEDEDAAIQMALQMSMQGETEADASAATPSTSAAASSSQQSFQDPQFVNQLLGSLAGVDPDDQTIKEALKKISKSTNDKKDEGGDKDDDKKDG